MVLLPFYVFPSVSVEFLLLPLHNNSHKGHVSVSSFHTQDRHLCSSKKRQWKIGNSVIWTTATKETKNNHKLLKMLNEIPGKLSFQNLFLKRYVNIYVRLYNIYLILGNIYVILCNIYVILHNFSVIYCYLKCLLLKIAYEINTWIIISIYVWKTKDLSTQLDAEKV